MPCALTKGSVAGGRAEAKGTWVPQVLFLDTQGLGVHSCAMG